MENNTRLPGTEGIYANILEFLRATAKATRAIERGRRCSKGSGKGFVFQKKSVPIRRLAKVQSSGQRGGKLTVTLDGLIMVGEGGISVRTFQDILAQSPDIKELEVILTTPGGDLFEGIALKNFLAQQSIKTTIIVKDYVASAGSLMIMGASAIKMQAGSELMIHRPWTMLGGNAKQIRKAAADLDKAQHSCEESYLTRFRGTRAELQKLLDDETWLTPEQAHQYGLADDIIH